MGSNRIILRGVSKKILSPGGDNKKIGIKVRLEGYDQLKAVLSPTVFKKAATRSINRAAKAGFNAGSKEIRKTYALKAKDIKKETKIKKASWSNLEAVVEIVSKDRISLKRFNPRQTKRGVSFRIRKDKKRGLIESAFIVDKLGGNVFKRKGKSRLPIKAMKADISAAELFDHDPIQKVVNKAADETMQKEFSRNWEYYAKKAKAKG